MRNTAQNLKSNLQDAMPMTGEKNTTLPPLIEKALEALREGKFVCIFDGDHRERETDLVMAAQFTRFEDVRRMRLDGGGLIFLMIHSRISEKFGLPFLAELFYKEGGRWPVLKELIPNDIPYDAKSSFSITINHRKTFTGVTDRDRALTISQFAKLSGEIDRPDITPVRAQRMLGESFRAPGHVPICASSKELLSSRKGHTELSTALLTMSGLIPVAVGSEMMENLDGGSLPKEKAQEYAKKNGLLFLEGRDIIEAWEIWSE